MINQVAFSIFLSSFVSFHSQKGNKATKTERISECKKKKKKNESKQKNRN